MNIFMVITKGDMGGAQMLAFSLARELKAKGHNVAFGFGRGDFLADELVKEKISYHRFRWLQRNHNPLAMLFFIFEMRKFVKMHDYEVVHFNSSNSLTGAVGVKLASRKIKTVFTFGGMSVLDNNHELHPVLRKIYFLFFKIFLKFIDKRVFISRENLSSAINMRLVRRGTFVYNGLNPEKQKFYEKDEARKLLKQFHVDVEDKYVIGSIGRLSYQKNYEFLVNTFDKIEEIKKGAILVVIGDGDKKDKLREMVKKRGFENKIFFIGGINNASRFLKAFDIFVLPSRYEGLSITLIETLMARIPALATDVGGNRETFLSESELFALNDKDDFLSKFKRLQYEETLKEVKEHNKKQAEKFDIKNTVIGYEEIYNSSNK